MNFGNHAGMGIPPYMPKPIITIPTPIPEPAGWTTVGRAGSIGTPSGFPSMPPNMGWSYFGSTLPIRGNMYDFGRNIGFGGFNGFGGYNGYNQDCGSAVFGGLAGGFFGGLAGAGIANMLGENGTGGFGGGFGYGQSPWITGTDVYASPLLSGIQEPDNLQGINDISQGINDINNFITANVEPEVRPLPQTLNTQS